MFKVSCFYQKVHNFLLCCPTIRTVYDLELCKLHEIFNKNLHKWCKFYRTDFCDCLSSYSSLKSKVAVKFYMHISPSYVFIVSDHIRQNHDSNVIAIAICSSCSNQG